MVDEILRKLASDCPLPSRCATQVDDVQRWSTDRLGELGLPLDAAALRRLDRARFAGYACRLYPDASVADLRVITVLFTWFFLVDDACDGPAALPPERIRALRDGTLYLLRHGPRLPHPGVTGPLRRLLVQAWREPRRRMPYHWRVRFADAVGHHLDGVWREAVNRTEGHTPGVDEYVRLRRATSAAYVSYPLVEFVAGRPLPEPVYHHPALRRVGDLGNDLLSWYNDLASLERDRLTSGGQNLVLAVAAERRVPVRAAVELVAERWRAAMARFLTLRAEVPSFGPALDAAVSAHLDGVAHAVRGTIDWTLESARYGKEGPPVNASGRAGAPC
ncbi:terpene synthase [Micromonospora rosaria]|uniref:Terpene synthase n=1 Tax=Micromonospora rosaria TaxID=47874 RepID=A0A136PWF3_9ACTN|nr:terpene synthase family protein [Micromonospora rosaria]KXK62851.1 terpene synthase [Micromonospora rosaria]